MKEKKNKFQKLYLMFFLCSFTFGNVAPGINSGVIAITEDISNQSIPEIQTELDSDVTVPADEIDADFEDNNISDEGAKQGEEINKENLPDFSLNKTEDELYKKSESSQRYIVQGVYGNVNWQLSDAGVLNIGTGGGTFPSTTVQSPPWKAYASQIKGINFDGGTNGIVYTGASAKGLFQDLKNVKSIENIENLRLGTSTTDTSYMFYDMSSLTSLNLGSYFDTSNVTDMSHMFSGMSSLRSLGLGSKFYGNRVTNTSYMFYGMSSLTRLNLPNEFQPAKITNMSYMFSGMSSLTSLDVVLLSTRSVKSMRETFSGMTSLTSLDLGYYSFDTRNVTDMAYMFSGMSSLTNLKLVGEFNTSNVKNMFGMFKGMSSLTSLDIRRFDTSQVTSMTSMFTNTSNLKFLILGENFKFIGSDAGLVGPSKTSEYTGKWINSDTKQNVWTSKELMAEYNGETDAGTYTWQKNELEVISEDVEYSLGTPVANLDILLPIIRVEQGGAFVDEKDYKVTMRNQIDTSKLGEQELQLRVMLKTNSTVYKDITVKANIIWGSTLVIEDNTQNFVDASVSLLHNPNGIPYLNANQGFGTLNPSITSQPLFQVFRQNDKNKLIEVTNTSMIEAPKAMAERWNETFEDTSLTYGDVAIISVEKWGGGENLHGEDTFISRNETLVKETVGYDEAYYELTPSGYRLLRLNQLVVNNNQKVKLNTSKEEMNKNISNFISLPEQIENPNDFRMEFESVDTASSGNKKSTINVYETLESGGEFKTTYKVAYSVNPEVTESYYDIDGKQIEQSQTTQFEYGQEFTPNPEKYIENKGVLYIYRGWVDTLPGNENIVPQEGVPEATKVEKNFYYIYEKADKLINVTLPTEIVFGTYEDSKVVTSKDYSVKNNSSEVDLEIDLVSFDKVKSDVQLLDKDAPTPTEKETSARLDLMVGDKAVIPGLTESTDEQKLVSLSSGQSSSLGISGTYFGESSERHKVEYEMRLKFKAQVNNKK